MKKYELSDKIHECIKHLDVSEIALENEEVFPNGESIACLLGEIKCKLNECINTIESEGIENE